MSQKDWNEKKTRKEYIDKLILNSKWGRIVPYKQDKQYKNETVEEHPTDNGPADYILFSNGKPLAIVEGKKVAVGPQNVLNQAQRYSEGLTNSPFNFYKFRVPFVYSTNGVVIWFRDLRDPLNLSREVAEIHTPSALDELLARDTDSSYKWLLNNPVNHPRLWSHQTKAIQSIEKSLLDKKRAMLLAMATGTGKTFTTINSIYRIMKSGSAKRILFLVDRRALAAQAVTALSSFKPEPGLSFDKIYEVYSQRFRREDLEDEKYDPKVLPEKYLTDPKAKHSFVYICTIQRMRINLFGKEGMFGSRIGDTEQEEDANILDIPIHAFDLIIADECHRGYTSQEESKWREVLNHFDAVKIGLTATPAAHTTSFFKEVVFRYPYEDAVNDGHLVDYDAVSIKSDITINGVFLNEGEEVGIKDAETGQLTFDELEDERKLEAETNEYKWTAPDRNKKIVKELKKYLLEQEEKLGRFPKTLIFAENDLQHTSHCEQLISILREEFNRGDEFVQKITGAPNVDRPLQRIREFRNRQNPGIVVTVDMLSTGVDIPKLENIVFLRPVKSRILFEQMMGRGTRICPEIGKENFTVFDCFNGTLLEYFRKTTSITAEAPLKPSKTIEELIKNIANNIDYDYNVKCLSKRLLRISKNITQESRNEFNYILKMDIADFAVKLPYLLKKHWQETTAILQSDAFMNIYKNHKKPKRAFIVAESAEDFVNSEIIFRASDGRELKPTDYIQMFEQFVKDNPEHIQAIDILLKRPKDFDTSVLSDLRKKLEIMPSQLTDKFTVRNLRRAYHKELVDIISLIKHAVTGEDIISTEERITKALDMIKSNISLDDEQEKWLSLIKNHLMQNLLIEKEDIDTMPIFARQGMNYKKLDIIFNNNLDKLLYEINQAVLQ